MKTKIFLFIILGIIIVAGAFFYETRPSSAPTVDVNTQVNHLSTGEKKDIKTLHIIGEESQAQFSLNEVLAGKPTLVVGSTHQVAGDIQVSTENPAKITIGEIKIDARTLKTDNERRNASLNRLILKTDKSGNEYITFKANEVTGLPEKIQTGQEFSYKIKGDLTISGVTKPATFEATSTIGEDGSFTGSANTTVTYADFNVSVPSLPFLSNVDKTTKLSISIVAK